MNLLADLYAIPTVNLHVHCRTFYIRLNIRAKINAINDTLWHVSAFYYMLLHQ